MEAQHRVIGGASSLVVHHRLSCVIAFRASSPVLLFSGWAEKWKRSIALSVVRHRLSYDEMLVRQGDSVESLYFITSGELKLVADPEQHKHQFADVIKQSTEILHDDS